jgi:hypothetical protein
MEGGTGKLMKSLALAAKAGTKLKQSWKCPATSNYM